MNSYNLQNNPKTLTHEDLPLQITRDNLYAKNHYTANGQKTLTKRYVNINYTWEEQISTYLGNVELKNGNFHALKHEEGRLMKNHNGGMHEEYFIKDHLGNVRVRFEDGEIQYEFSETSFFCIWLSDRFNQSAL